MKKILDYYYYRFNKTVWLNNEFESTYINTFIGISALLSFNIFTVFFVLSIPISVLGMLIIFAAIILLSYFYYINNGRWRQILLEYSKNDPYPVKGRIILFIYFALSFIGLVSAAYMKRNGIV